MSSRRVGRLVAVFAGVLFGFGARTASADSPEQPPDDEPPPEAPIEFKLPKHDPPADEEQYDQPSNPEPPTRLELGVRSGYAVPIGAAVDGGPDLNETVAGEVPLWFEVGGRFNDRFFFGANGMYAFGTNAQSLDDRCAALEAANPGASLDCGSSGLRFGLELVYHLPATPLVDPYVGGGVGWEWLTLRAAASVGTSSAVVKDTLNGMQVAMTLAGVDFVVAKLLRLGPFVALSNDVFFSNDESCEGDCTGFQYGPSHIDNTTFHHWVFVGVHAGAVL